LASSRLRLDRTLGPVVVQWIERNLVHGPGDVQGNRIELDDEQVRFICRAYEVDDRGRRVVRRAIFSRPKGRAKSELGGMLVAAEGIGPVRFAGWDHDGRPMGRPVQAPYIPCVATEEGQAADNIYAALYFMLREGPLERLEGLDVGLTRTYLPGGGKIQPVTAKATSKDGGRETFAAFDETHLFATEELRRLHATIRRNLAKRKAAEPWSGEFTTMYAPDEGSVAEYSHAYWQKIVEGALRDPGFLFDHRQGAVEFDWEDDEQLRAALVEVYGEAALWMDIERLIAEARDPQTTEEDFRRYFLNQPTRRATAWLGMGAWTACEKADQVVEDDERVILGFDGSYNRDSTGLVGCTLDGHVFLVKAWERPPKAPRDWVVDREDVNLEVHKAMRRWLVVELACDRSQWHSEFAEWARLYGEPPVIEFKNVPSNMGPACTTFYGAVAHHQLSHDGNPILRRHLQNAVTKETRDGAYITKDGRNSPRKIDVAIAAVMAYERAMVNSSSGGSGIDALTDEQYEAALLSQ
jgi:phage terminase large subunit-like protein